MEPIERSETSASNTQTPGNYPKETVLHLQHGENSNLKVTLVSLIFFQNIFKVKQKLQYIFNALYSSCLIAVLFCFLILFLCKKMRWAGHVGHMGEGRGVHRVLVGKPEGKR
jgi:L-lactate permease